MGSFIVNLHVRAEDRDKLVRTLGAMEVGGCWVTSPKNHWATVYEEGASTQNDEWIRELGGQLSRQLQTAVIAFLVHDSDVFCYWLYDRGELLDEYNSCPDYFGGDESHFDEDDCGDAHGAHGRADVLVPYCRPGQRREEIERVLRQRATFAEMQMSELASLIGIDADRAMTDFGDLGGDQDPQEIGAVFIGGGTDRPESSTSPPPRRPFSIFDPDQDDDEPEEESDEAPPDR